MTLVVSGHSDYVTRKMLLKRMKDIQGRIKAVVRNQKSNPGHEYKNTTKLKSLPCDYLTQGLKTITLLFWMTLISMNTICPLDCEQGDTERSVPYLNPYFDSLL